MKTIVFLVLICVLLAACTPATQLQAAGTSTAPPAATASQTPTTAHTQTPTYTSPPTSTPTPPLPTAAPFFILYIDNLAIGPGGQVYASGFNQGDDLRHFAVWKGTEWSELGSGFNTAGNSLAVDSAGNLYTEILSDTASCMAIMQWDGTAWQDITGNLAAVVDALQPGRVSCNVPVMTLAVDGEDQLYAAGTYYYPSADNTAELPMGYVAAWNNGSWSVLGEGFEGVNIYALAASTMGKVYVSGEQPSLFVGQLPVSGYLAQWDGDQWSQMDTDKPDKCTSVLQLTADSLGGVYTGCTPEGPGELISYWDGMRWTTLTDQLEGDAPVVYDMAVDELGRLYIGGDFTTVGGVPARRIAYWDGNAWQALGDGVNERVQALAFNPGGVLYAAGWFTEAGGVPVDRIAAWDGELWQALAP